LKLKILTMETAVQKKDKANGSVIQPATPDTLLAMAVQNNVDIDKLEKLMELQERWQKGIARKEFFQALSEFQFKVPEIMKRKEVKFKEVSYHYAPLADIVRQIKESVRNHGLTYRWEIKDENDKIQVTCLVTHTEGHTEVTTMTATPDDSGSKNKIQARGSSIEYMKRYTLIGALGLSTADTDIDARGEYTHDIEELHQKFMEVYNQVIQLDATKTVWHPDNWLVERTGKNYVKAIGDIRKEAAKLIAKIPQ
jgi:hypothetical protein